MLALVARAGPDLERGMPGTTDLTEPPKITRALTLIQQLEVPV
jgi:hypothetical protein